MGYLLIGQGIEEQVAKARGAVEETINSAGKGVAVWKLLCTAEKYAL